MCNESLLLQPFQLSKLTPASQAAAGEGMDTEAIRSGCNAANSI